MTLSDFFATRNEAAPAMSRFAASAYNYPDIA
jgi:hypothetical protein